MLESIHVAQARDFTKFLEVMVGIMTFQIRAVDFHFISLFSVYQDIMNKTHKPTQSGEWSVSRTQIVVVIVVVFIVVIDCGVE